MGRGWGRHAGGSGMGLGAGLRLVEAACRQGGAEAGTRRRGRKSEVGREQEGAAGLVRQGMGREWMA